MVGKEGDERSLERRGLFIVTDGLDGIGKGEVERALIQFEQRQGRAVFDTVSFSRAESKGLPELVDFWNPPTRHYHTVVTAEPTYFGIGKTIRDEMISKNSRRYSAKELVYAYGIDRHVQMQRVVVTALRNGLNVIQSRCCAATFAYEVVKAYDEKRAKGEGSWETIEEFVLSQDGSEVINLILNQEGNQYQLEHRPDLLIIPTIEDVGEVIRRIEARKAHRKDDKSIFDDIETQKKLKVLYQSDWLRDIFEKHGTKVVHLNAGISEEETRGQAVEIYKGFLGGLREAA